ncbi:MAG: hypothetical protein OEZ13_07555, partial [Spirochaetia bacterium]|nr:hypothetical protein [Spirochaetia bacterium]
SFVRYCTWLAPILFFLLKPFSERAVSYSIYKKPTVRYVIGFYIFPREITLQDKLFHGLWQTV